MSLGWITLAYLAFTLFVIAVWKWIEEERQ